MSIRNCILLFAFLPVMTAAEPQRRPNIVFILADDMGFDSVSANNDKIGNMKTPHIDKLISQGMSFTDAHSGSSVCTPTRYGLLTGRYAWRTKLKNQVLWQWAAPLIEQDRLTVAELLQSNGYHTGMVGKWHLGMDWYDKNGKTVNGDLKLSDASHGKDGGPQRLREAAARIDFTQPVTGGPTDHGFEYYFGVDVPNFPPYAWIENDRVRGIPSVPKPKAMFGSEGPMIPGWKLDEILPTLARKSAEYISAQSKKDKPFFLYVPLTSPHTPIAPSQAFLGKSGISQYADFVIETDWVVGHIVEAIDKAGVGDNTLVIFSTDNGTAHAANFKELEAHGVDLHNHYKGHKAQIHEGGHRLPFVARWPGVVKQNSTCAQTICLNDFMATVADMLGVTLPDNAAEDSTSILALLTGKQKSQQYRPMVVHHDFNGTFAIRDGKWKLVVSEELKLYDLDADIKETTNIAAKRMGITQHMADTLSQYKESGRTSWIPSRPKVLIIGDSISLGYTPAVAEMLAGEARVIHNDGGKGVGANAGPTTRGLEYLDLWLGGVHWDVIHFNWGLHDLCYRHPDAKPYGNRDKVNGTISTTLEQYEKNLDQLVLRLKKTGAKLIWASTTKVPDGEAGRFAGDELKYNRIAAKIMRKHGIAINDLHALTDKFNPDLFKLPGDVHYKKQGSQKLAEQVAASIRNTLK